VRLFVAVEIDERVRIAAVEAAGRLRQGLSRQRVHLDVRWVPVDNLHITLWFIGEVDGPRAAAIVSVLQPRFSQAPFDLVMGGLGAFPAAGSPRVFWLGVRSGQGGLEALHSETATRLRPLGLEPDRRPYSAHVTLARIKDAPRGSGAAARRVLSETPGEMGTSTVSAVTLFRSRIASSGSAYESVLRVPLR
jgi:2'-5' RNA ligase